MERSTGGLAVVVNPRTLSGGRAPAWESALARLRACRPVECVQTAGDAGDRDRIAALIAAVHPAIVVAAGGDGTVREVAEALHGAAPSPAPALAILPLGTGNNVARALGLRALRRDDAAVERAVAAILRGTARRIDLGRVGDRVFVGSFAVGMDGAILATRNAWRRRVGPLAGGYAPYLLSCAVNLARHRAAAGRLSADGEAWHGAIYDLLATNTALYAGEFRFDADDHSADGRLDLQLFSGPVDYVRGFVAAWRRHLRHQRGLPVLPAPVLRRTREAEVVLSRPLPAQLDGEELPAADRFTLRVLPGALIVRV